MLFNFKMNNLFALITYTSATKTAQLLSQFVTTVALVSSYNPSTKKCTTNINCITSELLLCELWECHSSHNGLTAKHYTYHRFSFSKLHTGWNQAPEQR